MTTVDFLAAMENIRSGHGDSGDCEAALDDLRGRIMAMAAESEEKKETAVRILSALASYAGANARLSRMAGGVR